MALWCFTSENCGKTYLFVSLNYESVEGKFELKICLQFEVELCQVVQVVKLGRNFKVQTFQSKSMEEILSYNLSIQRKKMSINVHYTMQGRFF